MIKSFRHKGLQKFFETGSKAGIRPDHTAKLQRQLAVLDNAVGIEDLPATWRPHQLAGSGPSGAQLAGHHAIWVSGNWRLTFYFADNDVQLLDYLDCH